MSAPGFGRRTAAIGGPRLHVIAGTGTDGESASVTSTLHAPPLPDTRNLSPRDVLFALLAGHPVRLTQVDLLAMANEPYDGLSSLGDTGDSRSPATG